MNLTLNLDSTVYYSSDEIVHQETKRQSRGWGAGFVFGLHTLQYSGIDNLVYAKNGLRLKETIDKYAECKNILGLTI